MKKLTCEEILAVYAAAPEAAVSRVQTLLAPIEQLEALEQQTAVLSARVRELATSRFIAFFMVSAVGTRAGAGDPPGQGQPQQPQAAFERRSGGRQEAQESVQKQRQEGRGQPGHPGCTLWQVAEPDLGILYAPSTFLYCGISRAEVHFFHGAPGAERAIGPTVDSTHRRSFRL